MKAVVTSVKHFLKDNRTINNIITFGIIPIVCTTIVIGQAYIQHAENVNFMLAGLVAAIGAKLSSYIYNL